MDRRLFAIPPLLALIALALIGSGAEAERETKSDVRLGASAAPAKAPPERVLAAATGGDRRYALANGCYSLRSSSGFAAKDPVGYSAAAGSVGAAEAFRMQATALGSYLFYGRDRDFMAANGAERRGAGWRRKPGRGLARGR